MVMQLIKTDGTDNKFLYYGTMALVVIGIIYIFKLIATKYNKNGSN